MTTKVSQLLDIVGHNYGDWWNTKKRYVVCKGSRASKKSKTTALWLIYHIVKMPLGNALCVRRYQNTIRDSQFSDLQWACERFGIKNYFTFKTSPLEIVYNPTGQKILFRGLDEGQKITSISVPKGYLCWVWIEEAYEIVDEEAFNKLDMSFRGQMPDDYFIRIMITFNPWSEQSWLKSRFFDEPSELTFTKTTNYLCNEWLSEADHALFEDMKKRNPRRYKIEGLGDWGIAEGLIYENVECRELSDRDYIGAPRRYKAFFGLDFGFTDPTAFVGGFVDTENKEIFICYELYLTNVTNQEIAKHIKDDIGLRGEPVYCDAAEPKSIEELRRVGINAKPAPKGPDSVNYGIQKIQNYKIIYSPKCTNFEHEIKNYCWEKDRLGKPTNKPNHEFSHCLTGDTLVMTEFGEIPIKKLVGKEGQVVCYDGKCHTLTHFYDCRLTRKNAPILKIEFEDGRYLKLTPDHLVMTKFGWKKAEDLRLDDEILSVYS